MVKSKKLGIIAGNRLLPIILAQRIKQNEKGYEIVALCFKGETSRDIYKYADKVYWLGVGQLKNLSRILASEGISQCIMAGQINPLRIFNRKGWDKELISLVESIQDFRPHTIFGKIIEYLESRGIIFLDSTAFLDKDLVKEGVMNRLNLTIAASRDVDFGLDMVSRFVELDVGQTIVIKNGSVVALESLEGTDRTIKRAQALAGCGCTILKFCKSNQDLRFDVPVVGISTLRLLRRIKASSLVLEKNKVIILEKEKFLSLAREWGIPVLGKERLTV